MRLTCCRTLLFIEKLSIKNRASGTCIATLNACDVEYPNNMELKITATENCTNIGKQMFPYTFVSSLVMDQASIWLSVAVSVSMQIPGRFHREY